MSLFQIEKDVWGFVIQRGMILRMSLPHIFAFIFCQNKFFFAKMMITHQIDDQIDSFTLKNGLNQPWFQELSQNPESMGIKINQLKERKMNSQIFKSNRAVDNSKTWENFGQMFLIRANNQEKKNAKWTDEQNLSYVQFLNSYQDILLNQKQRRKSKVFKFMSQFLWQEGFCKTAQQARGHHKKYMEKFKTIEKIVSHFQREKEKKALDMFSKPQKESRQSLKKCKVAEPVLTMESVQLNTYEGQNIDAFSCLDLSAQEIKN